jgi:type I restriction enzyme S subunit
MNRKNINIPEGWEIKKISKIASINPPKVKISDPTMPVSFIRMYDISEQGKVLRQFKKKYLEVSNGFSSFQNGDILIAKITPCFENGKGALLDNLINNLGFGSTEFHVLRANNDINSKYLFYHTTYYQFRKRGELNMTGSAGQKRIPVGFIESYLIPIPPLPEQQKIVAILSTWDRGIEKTGKLIEKKQKLKKTIERKLLSGNTRFKEFDKSDGYNKTYLGFIPNDWNYVHINELFEERSETGNNILKYPIYSLTIEAGITKKTGRYERSFLLRDEESNEYKLVYNDDIVYNPMNLRFGAIARSKQDKVVSVSAYYNVLKLKDKKNKIGYFEHLFKSEMMIKFYERIAIGSLTEKKRVHLSEFLKVKIPVPPIEEQQKIASVLSEADQEIELLKQKLEKLKEQKKGLMQKLLTGQIRVKGVNNV